MARCDLPTGVLVKLPGWIKSAVRVGQGAGRAAEGLARRRTMPHETRETRDAHETREIDNRTVPQEPRSATTAPLSSRACQKAQTSVAPEARSASSPSAASARSERLAEPGGDRSPPQPGARVLQRLLVVGRREADVVRGAAGSGGRLHQRTRGGRRREVGGSGSCDPQAARAAAIKEEVMAISRWSLPQ